MKGSETDAEAGWSVRESRFIPGGECAEKRFFPEETGRYRFSLPGSVVRKIFRLSQKTVTLEHQVELTFVVFMEIYRAYIEYTDTSGFELVFPQNTANNHLISVIAQSVRSGSAVCMTVWSAGISRVYFLTFTGIYEANPGFIPDLIEDSPVVSLFRAVEKLPRYTADMVSDIPFSGGVYFVFETNEYFGTYDRIVAAGTHGASETLESVLDNLFTGTNTSHEIRKTLEPVIAAEAAGRMEDTADSFAWHPVSSAEEFANGKQPGKKILNREVSAYARTRFSVAVIPMDDADKRKRFCRAVTSYLYYLYSRTVITSHHWLGLSHTADSVRAGLWQATSEISPDLPEDIANLILSAPDIPVPEYEVEDEDDTGYFDDDDEDYSCYDDWDREEPEVSQDDMNAFIDELPQSLVEFLSVLLESSNSGKPRFNRNQKKSLASLEYFLNNFAEEYLGIDLLDDFQIVPEYRDLLSRALRSVNRRNTGRHRNDTEESESFYEPEVYRRKPLELDVDVLEQAKSDLNTTTDLLHVAYTDDDMEPSAEASSPIPVKSGDAAVSAVGESEWELFASRLSPVQKQMLSVLVTVPVNRSAVKKLALAAGKLPDIFMDEINELAVECIGDAVIEDGEVPEEYRNLLKDSGCME